MDWGIVYKTLAVASGAVVGFLFGEGIGLLQILLVFVAIDYITGVFAAGKEGLLSSHAGLYGIARKIAIFLLVAMGHLIDTAIGTSNMVRDAAVFFYLANEALSIIENCGRLGVGVPEPLIKAVEILKSKGNLDK